MFQLPNHIKGNWFGSHIMNVINLECTFDSQSDNSTSLSLVN